MTEDLDQRERRELCDLFDQLGPDAPTLSGEWTTADLAAHLYVRERDPLGAPGILVPALGSLTDRRMAAALEKHGYAGVVDKVRSGPPIGPFAIPPVRRLVNLVEFFVHHEDVRRPAGLGPRDDRPDLAEGLWNVLGRMAPLMYRKAGVKGIALVLRRSGGGGEHRVGSGAAEVVIEGTPGELVLELYGRRSVAQVSYSGPETSVDVVRSASFGI